MKYVFQLSTYKYATYLIYLFTRIIDKVVIEELGNSMSLSDEYTISLYKDRKYIYNMYTDETFKQ